jgi:hypothetical protein
MQFGPGRMAKPRSELRVRIDYLPLPGETLIQRKADFVPRDSNRPVVYRRRLLVCLEDPLVVQCHWRYVLKPHCRSGQCGFLFLDARSRSASEIYYRGKFGKPMLWILGASWAQNPLGFVGFQALQDGQALRNHYAGGRDTKVTYTKLRRR